VKGINDKWAATATKTEDFIVTPFKKDIQVELFGIGWIPYWYLVANQQPMFLPAFG